MTSKLTPAMRRALESAARFGDPMHHLRGQAAHGGFSGTRIALRQRVYLDDESRITPSGRRAIGLPGELNSNLWESAD